MGVFSEQVLERQYDDDPFAEDNEISAFEEDGEMEFPPLDTQPPLTVEEATAPAKAELPASMPETSPQVNDSNDNEESDSQDAAEKQEASDSTTENEDAKQKAHEEAEAKRKAEWEAKQQQKKAAFQEKLDQLAAMSDDEVMTESAKQVGAATEKITRRNMKDCVAEFIQTKCLDDPAFARKTMHPSKNMIHCFRYISRKAWEYVQDELKADGITPGPGAQGYGCDIPDGLCYQWAVDYFNDPDAKEDQVEEEKFVPKPYYGGSTKTKKKVQKSAKAKKPEPKKPAPKPADDSEQLTLGAFAMPEEKAG